MSAQHIHDRVKFESALGSDWARRLRARWQRGVALLCVAAAGAAHAQVPGDPYNFSRASSFTYYGASDGARNGLLKSETIEPNNPQLCVTTTYDYDAYGNKTTATTANCAGASGVAAFTGRSSSSTYAALPAQTLTVNGTAYGGVTAVAGIFATTASNALNQAETRQYDPRFGTVTQLTGPNQLTTSWQVDDFGRKVKELRADGTSTVTFYCYTTFSNLDLSSNSANCPTPTSMEVLSDAVLFVHSEPRDANGVKMGPFVRVYSDKQGRQVRSVTEGFDGGAQPSSYSGALIVQDTIYSSTGAKIVQTQPYFKGVNSSTVTGANDLGMSLTVYDALGRPTTVYTADPNGSQAGVTFVTGRGFPTQRASVQTVTYTGLNTQSTNDKGQTRFEEKNPNGQTVRVTDATGAQIAYQHDAFGNLLTTKDALQNQITVSYDIRGRKTQMNDPDTGLWMYQYDALGQLVWQQSPNQRAATVAAAQQTTMVYDQLGRMTSRVEPEFTSTWSYDKYIADAAGTSSCAKGVGKLCESNTTNGVNKKIVYDGLGRPLNTRTTITGGPSFASAVAYDATTGRVASQTYPTGVKVGFSYTTNAVKGFLEKLTLLTPATVNPLPAIPGGSSVASQSLPAYNTSTGAGTVLWKAQVVNAWGRAEQQWYGNGVSTQATLEAATGRTTDLKAGTGNTVLNQHYAWDSLNNLTARSDANGDGNTGAVSETFAYADGLNRLTSYQVSAPAIPSLSRTVNLQYNALGMMLSKSDVGDYSYGTQGAGAVRPHALQSVVGAVNSSYTFDANGNITGSSGSTKYSAIAYTSFNLPDSQNGIVGNGGTRYTWQYDESHARIKEVRTIPSGTFAGTRTTWNLHPDNQGGLGFESEVNAPTGANGLNVSATSNRHYLSVGGQVIGVLVTSGALPTLAAGVNPPPTLASVTVVKLEYWHKDQLGSLITTTDHLANVTQRYAYDPFGKRRYTNGSYDVYGNLVVDWSAGVNYGTERGFTGHQELDEVGLVHMNGRIFDPTLGAFLQGDPLVQDQLNLQNYNRYGYCYSNPLTCSDPSGYGFADVLKYLDPNTYWTIKELSKSSAGSFVLQVANGVGSAWCFGWYAVCYGAGTATIASISGYSDSDALKAGVIAGASAYAMQQVGDMTTTRADNGVDWMPRTSGQAAANVFGHAVVGCASAEAGGGSCRSGALSAGLSAAWSNYAPDSVQGDNRTFNGRAQNIMISAMVGGTASVAGGGKFETGAISAAMGYLFNELMHSGYGGTDDERLRRAGWKETPYNDGTFCNIQGLGSQGCGSANSDYYPAGSPRDMYAVCGGGSNGVASGACVLGDGKVVPYFGVGSPGKSAQVVLALNNTAADYINGWSYNIQLTPAFGIGISPYQGRLPSLLLWKNTWAYTIGFPGASATCGAAKLPAC